MLVWLICVLQQFEDKIGQFIFIDDIVPVKIYFAENLLEKRFGELKVGLEKGHIFADKVSDFLFGHNTVVVDVVCVPDLLDNDLNTLLGAF